MKPFPCTVHRPRDCSAGLIVAFHGYAQSVSRFRRLSGLDRVADASKCMIVYPHGRARNWGGISAKKPKYSDVKRLELLLDSVVLRYGHIAFERIHLLGFSDGGSVALFAAAYLAVLWPIASVTAYSGLYHKVSPGLPPIDPYPIQLLHNEGEHWVRDVHQEEIRAAYEDRGHIVTQLTFPRRRRWFRHHYWRPEANQDVLRHIVEAMRKPITSGG